MKPSQDVGSCARSGVSARTVVGEAVDGHEYAAQAFEPDAVDYLLKRIQPQRLEAALARVSHQRSFDPQRLLVLLERALNVHDDATPRVTARAGKTVSRFRCTGDLTVPRL